MDAAGGCRCVWLAGDTRHGQCGGDDRRVSAHRRDTAVSQLWWYEPAVYDAGTGFGFQHFALY